MICCVSWCSQPRRAARFFQAIIGGTAGTSSTLSRNCTRGLSDQLCCVTAGTSTTSCLVNILGLLDVLDSCRLSLHHHREISSEVCAGGNLSLHDRRDVSHLSMNCTWSTPAVFCSFGSSGIRCCTSVSMSTLHDLGGGPCDQVSSVVAVLGTDRA